MLRLIPARLSYPVSTFRRACETGFRRLCLRSGSGTGLAALRTHGLIPGVLLAGLALFAGAPTASATHVKGVGVFHIDSRSASNRLADIHTVFDRKAGTDKLATGKASSEHGKTSKDKQTHAKKTSGKEGEHPDRDTRTLPKGDAKLSQLMRLWSVFGSEVHDSCSNFDVGNLHCFTDRDSLDALERYDRPVLLMLKEADQTQTVLLSVINDDNTVTLVGGDDARNVDRDRLLQLWTGRFTMIWRSESDARVIRPGSVGSPVIWLRQRLLLADGKDAKSQDGWLSPVYDQALTKRVEVFQKKHNLKADGVVGPRTQILLNDIDPAPGTPNLKPEKSSSPSSKSSEDKDKD